MKKNALVLIIVLINISLTFAQTLDWIATGAGNNIYSQDDKGYSVISDDNFVYVTGYIAGGNVMIEDTTISSGNVSFLAKFDKVGDLKWVEKNDGVEELDAAINKNGDIYVIYTTLYYESYLSKYDKDGNELWNKKTADNIRLTSITTDKDDNLIITGWYNTYYNDSLVIEDTVVYNISKDCSNGFVMKYNFDDEFEWFNTTRVSNSGGYVTFKVIQTDNSGNIYVFGEFELFNEDDSLKIGDTCLKIESNPDYAPYFFSHKDIILTKLNSNGKFIWTKQYGGYDDDFGNKIDVTENGNVFMIGNFNDSICFGNNILTTYGLDIYIGKISTEGEAEWAVMLGSNAMNSVLEQGNAIAVSKNNIYIGGAYDGSFCYYNSTNKEDTTIVFNSNIRTGFFATYTLTGDFVDVQHIKVNVENFQGENTKIEDICINNENVYLTGNFYPPSTFFDATIPSVYSNSNHFFLAAIDTNNTNTSVHFFKKEPNNIKFYPNPAQDYLIIEIDDEVFSSNVTICDIEGNVLISKKYSKNDKLDVSSLPDGMYILKVFSNNNIYIEKFFKVGK